MCGSRAEIVRGRRAEREYTRAYVVDGPNHPAYFPSAAVVAIAFSQPPLRTVLSVEISAANPDDYTAQAEAIIASIRCL